MMVPLGCVRPVVPFHPGMTEGVPMSEIEAYEQDVLAMEAEDTSDMDDVQEEKD